MCVLICQQYSDFSFSFWSFCYSVLFNIATPVHVRLQVMWI